MDPPRELSTTHHEAGHAVMAYLEGVEIKSITIIPDDTYAGFFETNIKEKTTTNKDLIESLIKIRLAGAMAEAIYISNIKADYYECGFVEDFQEVVKLTKGICNNKEESIKIVEKLQSIILTILSKNWRHRMEKVTFPKTGPANKYGVQLLFEDDEVKIIRWDNRLVRGWKNGRLDEYVMLEGKDSIIPEFVEWQEMIDMREYKFNEDGSLLVNQRTGHEVTMDQLKDVLGKDQMMVGG